ncbi:MAG: polyprenyl synthetase family protein [Sedimentisphaerales bacterium]|nr:polyprenyl synthetase family protein [Sedimentisphaerales bacterium]
MQLLKAYDFLAMELEEVREIFEREMHCDVPAIADMIDQVGKFRGKMLRPVLVLLCGRACGHIHPSHRTIATVVEMVHMATLIHDDVLDEADYRRRGPTINSLHGNEAAVILGDMFISHAFHLCSSLDSQSASRLIAATTNTVCEGELMQLYYRGYHDLSERQYLEIIDRKTASLIASCCYLGARAAGAAEAVCLALEQYGRNLGLAFQITDDILDLTGQEQLAGKTLGTDLIKEKMTLPLIHLRQNCPAGQRKRLLGLLSEPTPDQHARLLGRLRENGSIRYARACAARYIQKARRHLPADLDGEIRTLLLDLAGSITA